MLINPLRAGILKLAILPRHKKMKNLTMKLKEGKCLLLLLKIMYNVTFILEQKYKVKLTLFSIKNNLIFFPGMKNAEAVFQVKFNLTLWAPCCP